MDRIIERCAGLDVHKDSIVACVRTTDEQASPSYGNLRHHYVGSTRLTRLARTPPCYDHRYGVDRRVLEARLLLAGRHVRLLAAYNNARHMHNVPGRKTDVADAAWIAQLVEHGLVLPSFVPPREFANYTTLRAIVKRRLQNEVERSNDCRKRSRTPASSSARWQPT